MALVSVATFLECSSHVLNCVTGYYFLFLYHTKKLEQSLSYREELKQVPETSGPKVSPQLTDTGPVLLWLPPSL